jgi:hypothetical protein
MPRLAIIYEHDTLAAPGLRDNSTECRDRVSNHSGNTGISCQTASSGLLPGSFAGVRIAAVRSVQFVAVACRRRSLAPVLPLMWQRCESLMARGTLFDFTVRRAGVCRHRPAGERSGGN